MKSPPLNVSWAAYRWAVLSRTLAAVFGGYALSSVVAACLAVWLPLPRADAVMTGLMVSFVVYAVAVVWVFATRNAYRAWAGVVLPTVGFMALFALKRWVLTA